MKHGGAFGLGEDAFADHQLYQANHGHPFRAAVMRVGFQTMRRDMRSSVRALVRMLMRAFVRRRVIAGHFRDPFIQSDALSGLLLVEGDTPGVAGAFGSTRANARNRPVGD